MSEVKKVASKDIVSIVLGRWAKSPSALHGSIEAHNGDTTC